MKKLLVTGGVLFSILPAMATDLSLSDWHLIDSNTENPTCSGPEGYTGFVNGDVTMAPLYIQQCDPGYYLNATSETQIQEHQDSNEDLDYYYIQACTQCQPGHSCAGVSHPTVVNDSLGVMGLGAECSAGTYAATGQSSCTACAPGTYTDQTGQSSCTNAQAGYYTPNTTSEELCPVGYQDGAAGSGTTIDACSKTISCPATCSNNVKHTKTCTIDDTLDGTSVAFGSANRLNGSCFEQFTCEDGYEKQNIYSWLYTHPESVSSNVAFCSPDGTGAGCSDVQNPMERGTSTWIINGNDKPVDTLHFVNVCTNRMPDLNASQQGDYSSFVVDQSVAQFSPSDTGAICWSRNTDRPDQPWFYTKSFSGNNGGSQACAENCGRLQDSNYSSNYAFGDYQDDRFVPHTRDMLLLSVLATHTANNVNAQFCFARTVSISWAGVAEPGAAATCTYGESLTVPTPDTNPEGYNFVGWTVGEVTNNNNNQNNNSNEEPGNEEPGNEEPGNNEPE